jgi:hypothetical protein
MSAQPASSVNTRESRSKCSVATNTVGNPRSSAAIPTRMATNVHDPQLARPVTTASTAPVNSSKAAIDSGVLTP